MIYFRAIFRVDQMIFQEQFQIKMKVIYFAILMGVLIDLAIAKPTPAPEPQFPFTGKRIR
jgi:hypothetical protein